MSNIKRSINTFMKRLLVV